ncbi:VCBS repeat-containing protein [Emticicia sp. SJ17W-69]|uniref:VCBS repeat-containing protein n=1 Tax=Emticicia sp. SJ17W-69 TaxID=3421657 RepID=UPI003EBBC2EA
MKFILTTYFFLVVLFGCKQKTDKLFEKVSSKNSNVDFVNSLKADEKLNAFTFTNFYNGGGVGIGDFNNDGLDDIIFTANQASCDLYLNKGNLKFDKITKVAGLTTSRWCNGVSIVDINNDGWDDIYISVAFHQSMKETRNLLFINQKTKNPTFKEQASSYGLDYAGYTTQSVFFDYDSDGDLDVFLLNTSPDTQNPSYLRPRVDDGTQPSTSKLFQNFGFVDGHPIFKDVSKEAGILYEGLGLGVVVADYNNDNLPDIYCSNDFLSSDILYQNNGDGTFTNVLKEAMPHTAMSGMGVDAADINQDGKVDLFQLDMLPETNARQKQMLGKHDYDKKEMSIRPPHNYQLQYMRNMLQVNLGNKGSIPQFSENGLLAGVAKTDWSWSTLLCDLDNDRLKDIFISNGYRKNVTDLDFISYYQNQNMFGSDKARAENRMKLLEQVPEIQLKNYAYRNNNSLDFENVSETWGLDELSYANGSAFADLDNDGDLDLIVNNIDSEASIFKNNTEKQLQNKSLKIKFEGNKNNIAGIGAKVSAWLGGEQLFFENFPVRGYLSSMPKSILIGIGNAQKIDSLVVWWPDGKVQKKYNINNSLKNLTLKYSEALLSPKKSFTTEPLFQLVNNSLDYQNKESSFNDFNETATLHKMLSRFGPAVTKADINGDGLEDIAIGGSYMGTETQIYSQTPKGGFFKKFEILTSKNMEVGAVHFFDSDNDGDQDLILAGGGCERPLDISESFQPQLWKNDGKGKFLLADVLPKLNVSSRVIETFDFDNDKDLDIFIGGRLMPNQYPTSPKSYILRNDNGKFVDITAQVAPFLNNLGMVCDAVAIDIDKDNFKELVLVGEWMPLTILKNNHGKLTLQQKENTEGWWNTIEVADLNSDGLLDLVLGNEGKNSFYKAKTDQPVVLLAKDFDGNGRIDPIMGQYINNELVPVHPRENLNLQINSFRKKYTTYKDYASVLFDDLLSENDKKESIRKEVYDLSSSIAINNGKGDFILSKLPWQAQQAPVFSIITKDFNQDGHIDILLGGNFFANEAHQGRQDASRGTILLGNGKGGFKAVSFEESGLNLINDIRSTVFLNKNNILLVFANSGSSQTYKLMIDRLPLK